MPGTLTASASVDYRGRGRKSPRPGMHKIQKKSVASTLLSIIYNRKRYEFDRSGQGTKVLSFHTYLGVPGVFV